MARRMSHLLVRVPLSSCSVPAVPNVPGSGAVPWMPLETARSWMRHSRSSRLLLAAVLVTAGLSGAVLSPSAASAAPATGRVVWKPCGDKGAECGTVAVPVDWASPGGAKVELALSRRRATRPASRIGSLVLNPGGPGGAGAEWVRDSARPLATAAVAERFDLVGFDPRGVGASSPITCDKKLYPEPEPPTNAAEFAKVAERNRALAQDCRRRTGPLFDHVDNLAVARDIEAVRAALGDEKLTFLGYSYGTFMGQQYAELFPGRVRALVLDGNMDHSLPTAWDFMRTETVAAELNFVAFANWCDSQRGCALHGRDTRKVYAGLREKARSGKLTDPKTGERIGFYRLAETAFFGAVEPASEDPAGGWAGLARELKRLSTGDRSVPVGIESATVSRTKTVSDPFQAMFCQDWRIRIRDYAEWQTMVNRLATVAPNLQWTAYNRFLLSCTGYPGPTTNPQRPLRIKGAPPLVMVGNTYDYATTYEWTRTAAQQSGAVLLTYQGFGHTAYVSSGSACVDRPLDAYLISLKVPARGISCPGLEKPGARRAGGRPLPPVAAPWAWSGLAGS